MWTAIILICTAASFGVVKDGKQQCAYGAPGMVEAHRVPGTFATVGECHNKASDARARYGAVALAKDARVATWQCMSPSDAAGIK
jgi:hypothetical protein